MDHIHDDRAFTQQNDHSLNDRALLVTSGNRQIHTTDRQEHSKIEVRQHGRRYHDRYRGSAQALTNQYGAIRFPVPRSILGSNDRGAALRQTLAHRRLWQRFNAPRPYMNHPSYIRYTHRPRRDTNKAGEVIWNDAAEEAFQNALACIPPMGKKKRSQNGKPHGRNELIAEWILYETGQDVRKRKQVSSHLQVLDNFLKEVPEWQAVRRERDSKKKNDDSSIDHYFNSVEEVVREVRRMKSDPFYRLQYAQEEQLLQLNDSDPHRLRLGQLDFGMWVSLPDSMDHPSHRYTALHNTLPQSVPVPLDSIMNWQSSFPDLDSIVQTMTPANNFDIILLDVTLRLMKHFPMPTSKLGISLGLDFTASDASLTQVYENSKSWISTTHIYHSGKTIQSTEPKKCPISESRMVKPQFESKWWAFEFTRLTDERQRAEDTGDEDDVYDVDESHAHYLRNLSMMQQIYTIPEQLDDKNSLWQGGEMTQKRMAILLWRFSASPMDEPGMTTWQRIVPSVEISNTAFVEPANIQTELPLGMLQHPMDEMHQAIYGMPHGYEYPIVHVDHTYSPTSDEELCHDGFVLGAQPNIFNSANGLLHHVDGNVDSASSSFSVVHDFGSIEPSQQLIDYNQMTQEMSARTDVLNNYFHQEDQVHHHEDQTLEMQQDLVRHSSTPESCLDADNVQNLQNSHHHQPLQNFDISTHKVLQEQLGTFPEDSKFDVHDVLSDNVTQAEALGHNELPELDEEALKQALLAASAIHHVEDQQNPTYPTNEFDTGHADTSQSSIIAPVAIRPPLRPYHSFAGIYRSQSHGVFDVQRHQVRQLPARLEATDELARLEAGCECASAGAELTNNELGHELMRAHSQPDFLSTKFEDCGSVTDDRTDEGCVMVGTHAFQET